VPEASENGSFPWRRFWILSACIGACIIIILVLGLFLFQPPAEDTTPSPNLAVTASPENRSCYEAMDKYHGWEGKDNWANKVATSCGYLQINGYLAELKSKKQ